MFRVTVDPEIHGTAIWVKWCLDRETQKILDDRVRGKVRLLLVITGGDQGKEHRVLVPIEDVMSILPARYPGKNTIFAAIVWSMTTRDLKDYYLGRDKKGNFQHNVVIYPDRSEKDEAPALSGYWYDDGIRGPSIEVEVPKEIFAEEPPEWEKKWVGFFHSRAAMNQCEFRKWRIFAYTLQPILALVFLAIVIAVLIIGSILVFLVGFYEFDFPGLLLPARTTVFYPHGRNYWAILWRKLFPEREETAEERNERFKQKKEQLRLAMLARINATAGCRLGADPPVPLKKRVLRLYYEDLKDKVCKPFVG